MALGISVHGPLRAALLLLQAKQVTRETYRSQFWKLMHVILVPLLTTTSLFVYLKLKNFMKCLHDQSPISLDGSSAAGK